MGQLAHVQKYLYTDAGFRKHLDPPKLWWWVAMGSLLLHFGLLLLLPYLLRMMTRSSASAATPIEIVDLNTLGLQGSETAEATPDAQFEDIPPAFDAESGAIAPPDAFSAPQPAPLPNPAPAPDGAIALNPELQPNPQPNLPLGLDFSLPPQPSVPDSQVPESQAPDSQFPESQFPESPSPEATAPSPQPFPPETSAPETPGDLGQPPGETFPDSEPLPSPPAVPNPGDIAAGLPDQPDGGDRPSSGNPTDGILPDVAIGGEAMPTSLVATIVSTRSVPESENPRDIPEIPAQVLDTSRTFLADPTQSGNCLIQPESLPWFGVEVDIQVTIDASGRVIGTTVRNSSGNADYADLAACLVQRWEFSPATTEGMAIASDYLIVSVVVNRAQ
ncbi:MAG: TonB family protein [Kaiparowitsia implicata GSE-PSE-MK54-09C]|jgi:TonB family protein|nr:TonB family protein [Kaiparowitsia implicata GSE-PSE-MK54-09C]